MWVIKNPQMYAPGCSCHSAITFGCLEMVMGSSGESPGQSKGQNDGVHGAPGNLQWSRALSRSVPQQSPQPLLWSQGFLFYSVFTTIWSCETSDLTLVRVCPNNLQLYWPHLGSDPGAETSQGWQIIESQKKLQRSGQIPSASDNGTSL